ncbi:bacterial ribosomal protein bS21 family protein [Pleurotus pulmonarius]
MFAAAVQRASTLLRPAATLSNIASASRILLGSRTYSSPAFPTETPYSTENRSSGPLDATWGTLMKSYPKENGRRALQSPHEVWAMNHDGMKNRPPPANAYTGRTVFVGKNGFGEAYKRLDIILSRNKVRATVRMAERHEKKGVKRRRLSSERWRRQFANEVRKKVQLVKEIRNRGA